MKKKRCRRCVLPECPPDVLLDEKGVCSICRAEEGRPAGSPEVPWLETDFIRLLRKYRGKGKYDCLVMCSGGQDSIASLYLMKRRYRMSPLAFTFDLGFETEEALANVRNAVTALEVDWVVHRTSDLLDLFRRVIEAEEKAVLCHLCSMWYMQLTFETAKRYRTPLIIAGWTRGQAVTRDAAAGGRYGGKAPEYASMARATEKFVAKLAGDPKYSDFPKSMEEVVRRAGRRPRPVVQSPHWYLAGGTEDFREIIEKELSWRQPARSYPAGSTNCALNFLSSRLALTHHGYTHYHVEMSKLIRQGLLTREEALEKLRPDFDEDTLRKVAEQCGCRP